VLRAIRCFNYQIGKIAPVTVHDPDEEQRSDAVRSITGTDAPIHRDDHTFAPGDADEDVMYLKEGNLNHVETTHIDVRSSDLTINKPPNQDSMQCENSSPRSSPDHDRFSPDAHQTN
jgi:hypothetical protein